MIRFRGPRNSRGIIGGSMHTFRVRSCTGPKLPGNSDWGNRKGKKKAKPPKTTKVSVIRQRFLRERMIEATKYRLTHLEAERVRIQAGMQVET